MDATWAIVELMGRSIIAGRISEENVAGVPMLRVDVPAIGDVPAYTKFFSGSAIYGLTPTDEATATAAAQKLAVQPVSPYVFPRQLPAGSCVVRAPGDEEQDYPEDNEEEEEEVPF